MDSVTQTNNKRNSNVQKSDIKSINKNLLAGEKNPVSLDTTHAQCNRMEEVACYGGTGTGMRGSAEGAARCLAFLT